MLGQQVRISIKTIAMENYIILGSYLLLNSSVKINKENVGQDYYI